MAGNEKQPPVLERDDFSSKLYEQICINIRTSDDISFKLMGLVPLISGSGAAVLSLGSIWSDISSMAVILLALVAAVITFGLFKWEMRNVQKCNWLIDRATDIESGWNGEKIAVRQFAGWSDVRKPPLFGRPKKKPDESGSRSQEKGGIGKTESEKIIYWASIIAWLVPAITALVRWRG
jgi:hypothetical protein